MTGVLFVGLCLCSYRLTRLITKDSLFDRQRRWWFRKFPPNGDYSRLYDKPVSKWGQLIQCPWCCGFWVSGFVVFLVLQFEAMTLPLLWWFAVSAAVGLTAKNLD